MRKLGKSAARRQRAARLGKFFACLAGMGLLLPAAGIAAQARNVAAPGSAGSTADLSRIGHIVVIYAENHSFDQLFGDFPGADGVLRLQPAQYQQRDRDGSLLPSLPRTWGGVTAPRPGGAAPVPAEKTAGLPNAPFAINAPTATAVPYGVAVRDLWHRFYENQMQIDGGRNDRFAAWSDAGGLTMGYWARDGKSPRPLDDLAHRFVLAERMFQGAFGGSYLNHQYLICACANTLTPAQQNRARRDPSGVGRVVVPVSLLEADHVTLKPAAASPASALDGPPLFAASTSLTPFDAKAGVYYAVNTMQPPYPPSGTGLGADGKRDSLPQVAADLDDPKTMLPQTATTIGDQLSAKGISWAWYAGGMAYALAHGVYNMHGPFDARGNPQPNFQAHHNPFNYYAAYAPGTAARAEHLRDGGMDGASFLADADAGRLPQVSFYKPQGNLNAHPGYTDDLTGDLHVRQVVDHLMKGPQWKDMVIIITYDENGGQWDHVPPPHGDFLGPGTRVPALIISPFSKHGFIDRTPYDTASVLRLIAHRFGLETLPGVRLRDLSLVSNGFAAMGDFTNALELKPPRH